MSANSLVKKKVRWGDMSLKSVIYFVALLVMVVLAAIIGYMLVKGTPLIDWRFLTTKYTGGGDYEGIFLMVINTLYIVVLTLLIVTPIGVLSAIYLTEYAKQGRVVRVIRFTTETLAGIPSIIYGLFGYVFIGTFISKLTGGMNYYTILSGAVTMAIMTMPTIVRTTEEALCTVPNSLREASYALGAGKLRTIFRVVLPNAVDGILAAIILTMGRVFGESAALIFTAGMGLGEISNVVKHMFESGRNLTLHLYLLATEAQRPEQMQQAYATAVVLLLIILALNLIAKALADRLKKNKGEEKKRSWRGSLISGMAGLLVIAFTVYTVMGGFTFNTKPVAVAEKYVALLAQSTSENSKSAPLSLKYVLSAKDWDQISDQNKQNIKDSAVSTPLFLSLTTHIETLIEEGSDTNAQEQLQAAKDSSFFGDIFELKGNALQLKDSNIIQAKFNYTPLYQHSRDAAVRWIVKVTVSGKVIDQFQSDIYLMRHGLQWYIDSSKMSVMDGNLGIKSSPGLVAKRFCEGFFQNDETKILSCFAPTYEAELKNSSTKLKELIANNKETIAPEWAEPKLSKLEYDKSEVTIDGDTAGAVIRLRSSKYPDQPNECYVSLIRSGVNWYVDPTSLS